jgi:hypothetical protein
MLQCVMGRYTLWGLGSDLYLVGIYRCSVCILCMLRVPRCCSVVYIAALYLEANDRAVRRLCHDRFLSNPL